MASIDASRSPFPAEVPDRLHVSSDLLRSAAAWLNLAAAELDRGNVEQAAGMAEVALFAAECAPDRIRRTTPAVAA